MDDLFEIKPAFRAHGIMVNMLGESEGENIVAQDEKRMEDEHIGMA
jgi:hypothetical protein